MKKLFFTVLTIMLVTKNCLCQKNLDQLKAQWIFSFLAGLNGSFISGEGDSWKGIMPGGQFGLMLSFDRSRNDRTVLSAETVVSMQGSKYEEPTVSGKVMLTYLNVPMMIQRRNPNGLYGEVGIQPGFLIAAKDKYNNNSNDYKEQVNKFDFGIPLGVGYVIKRKLGVSLRFTLGLSNVNNPDFDDAKDHNRNFALRFFYNIPVIK